jgi:hypothetical protein
MVSGPSGPSGPCRHDATLTIELARRRVRRRLSRHLLRWAGRHTTHALSLLPTRPTRTPRFAPSAAPSRWELLFWVIAAGIAGALVMLLFLPDRFELAATPPPVRTLRLVRPSDGATKAVPSAAAAPGDEVEEEPAAERAELSGEEPTRRDLEAGMAAAEARVLACRSVENFAGLLSVRVVITRGGQVQSATVLPPNDQTPTASCVAHAVQSATFAHFRGQLHPTVELIYPFSF